MKYLTITKIKQFDSVTRFRLLNAFIVGIGLALLAPVLVVLKGVLLPVWVISMFGIIATIAVKTNDFFCKYSISQLYHLGIVVHIILVVAALLYFVSPLWMVVLESLVGILEAAIFSAYAVLLNDYLAQNYSDSMKKFGIIRNNSWADAGLIGLTVVTIVTYFFSTGLAVGLFILYNSVFSAWMLYNWNFFSSKRL